MLKSKFVQKMREITKINIGQKSRGNYKNYHKSAGNYNYKNYKKVREIAKIKIFQESAGNYENPNYKKVRDISN